MPRLLFLPAGEQPVSYAAIDALVRLAVGGVELQGCLAVERRLHDDTGCRHAAHDVVVFGRQAFEQPHGLVGEDFAPDACRVGVEQGSHTVDDEQSHGTPSQCLDAGRRFHAEGVVRVPITFEVNVEERLYGLLVFAFEQAGKEGESPVYELRQQGDALVGKVGRAQPHEFPGCRVDGREREFVAQEVILPAQTRGIGVGSSLFTVEQTGLPEEECLDLQQRVGMLLQEEQRQAARQPLEGVAVHPEAHAPGQGDVAHLFPVALVLCEQVVDAAALLLQAFECEGGEPVGEKKGRELTDAFAAGQQFALRGEEGIVVLQCRWNGHDPLRHRLAVGAEHLGIGFGHDVQHHRVVGFVGRVSVHRPVACPQVHLHIARPQAVADTHLGVEKVGPGIGVAPSRVDDLDGFAPGGQCRHMTQQPLFPHVVEEFFHKKVYMQKNEFFIGNTTFT